jgi:hypothetical protein
MVVSETVVYVSVFALTIVFTAFALVLQETFWRFMMRIIAGTFWMVLGVSMFIFLGPGSSFVILSLPFVIFGLLFVISIVYDTLKTKHDRPFIFDD